MHLSYPYVLLSSLTDILVHKTNSDLICSFFKSQIFFYQLRQISSRPYN